MIKIARSVLVTGLLICIIPFNKVIAQDSITGATGTTSATGITGTTGETSATRECYPKSNTPPVAEPIKLYYNRTSSNFIKIINSVISACKDKPTITSLDDTLIVYGSPEIIDDIKRIVTILDLPKERVNMAMWGIYISSKNPKKLSEGMRQINQEISEAQRLIQETYGELEQYAKNITINKDYLKLYEETLGYEGLEKDRTLSMTDILLRINAANDPLQNYSDTAKNICNLFKKPEYQPYIKIFNSRKSSINKVPFGNFLRVVAQQKQPIINEETKEQICSESIINDNTPRDNTTIRLKNLERQRAILEFALHYANRVKNPTKFDSSRLQGAAENLNSLLNPVVEAINRDVEELFIDTTLQKIQNIVRKVGGIEYAEAGKVSVAGINQNKATVAADTMSVFDETLPLTLEKLLSDASESNDDAKGLWPRIGDVSIGSLAVPTTSLVSALAAISTSRTQWRELSSGLKLDITPSVLRNSTSAELDIVFSVNPNAASGTNRETPGTENNKLKPLSRFRTSSVVTKVYVNTLDLFAISTFNSQTTIDGGRSYIPIVGTIWQGIFGDIPIFGRLFSWKNSPKNVQHQSVVLTNTFIAPTAMGIAPLYSGKNNRNQDSGKNQKNTDFFYDSCSKLQRYLYNQSKLTSKVNQSELILNDLIQSENKENSDLNQLISRKCRQAPPV